MISFAEKIAALEAEGYANAPARAKLAHDVVLKAMEVCGVAKNITVKGGVVMSGLTGDVRRATMDMDARMRMSTAGFRGSTALMESGLFATGTLQTCDTRITKANESIST